LPQKFTPGNPVLPKKGYPRQKYPGFEGLSKTPLKPGGGITKVKDAFTFPKKVGNKVLNPRDFPLRRNFLHMPLKKGRFLPRKPQVGKRFGSIGKRC